MQTHARTRKPRRRTLAPAPATTPNPPILGGPQRSNLLRSGEVGPKPPERENPATQARGSKEAAPPEIAVRARNATTHGLFARDIVLTHLGEDPAAFDTLLAQLCTQLPPRNHLERHYLEQIAAASWRLRRLHRWQAQVYEDPTLTEDQRIDKLDKVLRHEIALTRQIDRAVRTLNRDLKWLFDTRARDEALYQRDLTEAEIRADPELGIEVQRMTWKQLRPMPPWNLGDTRLDNATETTQNTETAQNCQNETQNCQNETQPTAQEQLDHGGTQAPLPSEGSGKLRPAAAGEKTTPTGKITHETDYIAYRKREQALYNQLHPDKPDPTDWDNPEAQEMYGKQTQKPPGPKQHALPKQP